MCNDVKHVQVIYYALSARENMSTKLAAGRGFNPHLEHVREAPVTQWSEWRSYECFVIIIVSQARGAIILHNTHTLMISCLSVTKVLNDAFLFR